MSEDDDAAALLERAETYLNSAQLLLDAEDLASSISRGYYAMFFAAEAALLREGVRTSTHRGLINAFGEHFVETGVFPDRVGRDLATAFQKRQVGDYEARPGLTRDDAEKVLKDARSFVDAVAEHLGP